MGKRGDKYGMKSGQISHGFCEKTNQFSRHLFKTATELYVKARKNQKMLKICYLLRKYYKLYIKIKNFAGILRM